MPWTELGSFAPTDFVEERLQAHWAVQPLSAAANIAIKAQPGDAHTNLGWDREHTGFTTNAFAGAHVAGLSLADLAIHWDVLGVTKWSPLVLEGKTLDEARSWLTEHVRSVVPDLPDGPVPLRDYEMPDHPIAAGRPFAGSDPARRLELARWFMTADEALSETARAHAMSSDVRTWPHHFDIGLLINYEPDADPEQARSIGVGMSPGDASIPQPYYYVNPYPRPDVNELPELPGGGYWEQTLFFGALLTGEALLGGGDPAGRRGRVLDFLANAIDACRVFLAVPE